MPSPHVTFGTIVATSSPTAWSQVYHAGNLFAVLSLSASVAPEKTLNSIGKEVFNNLEAEFFTLEQKNLATIKEALESASKDIDDSVKVSLSVAFIADNVLYCFVFGGGSVMLRREGNMGTILHPKGYERITHAASGYLNRDDTIIVATAQFAINVPHSALNTALSGTIDEAVDALAPKLQDEAEGTTSGIFIRYSPPTESAEKESEQQEEPQAQKEEQEPVESTPVQAPEPQRQDQEQDTSATPSSEDRSLPSPLAFFRQLQLPRITGTLSHRKKVMLTIAVVLLLVLSASTFLTIQKKQHAETEAKFTSVYTAAEKHYEDGQGLVDLNKTLARDDFLKAQKILADNKASFQKGSKEERKITELETKVNQALGGTGDEQTITATQVDAEKSLPLQLRSEHTDALATTENEDAAYYITKKAVIAVAKDTKKEKTIIENDNDWSEVVGLGTFGSNIYVLDQAEGLLKFIPAGSDYTKSTYFKGKAPNLTEAIGLAIDGSVYILFKDGTVAKYTKGVADTFDISGVDPKLTTPSHIATTTKATHVYIVDREKKRLLQLKKNGEHVASFNAEIFAHVQDIAIPDSEQQAYILSSKKVYEVRL